MQEVETTFPAPEVDVENEEDRHRGVRVQQHPRSNCRIAVDHGIDDAAALQRAVDEQPISRVIVHQDDSML